MGEVFESLFSIIWLIVLFTVFKNVLKKDKKEYKGFKNVGRKIESFSAKFEESAEDDDDEPELPQSGSYEYVKVKSGEPRPSKSILRDISTLSETMSEDRQHDWLARQIREEKKRVVWNNFVDLGAAHDEICSAELNRKDHRRHHQEHVVDDGVTDN